MTQWIEQPPINVLSKGAGAMKGCLIDAANQIWILPIAVAPTSGTSGDGAGWTGPGSMLIRTDTPKLYINTGTAASPTWTVVGSQS